VTVHIRPATDDDRAFVLSNWSSSYRSSQDVSYVPMRRYAAMYRPVFEEHFDAARVLVAHGELGVLMGFIVYDPSSYGVRRNGVVVNVDGYVLYVCVGEDFRRRGIAKKLFAAAGIPPTSRFAYAARTRWSWLLRHKIPAAVYDTYRARYDEVGKGDTNEQRAESEAAVR